MATSDAMHNLRTVLAHGGTRAALQLIEDNKDLVKKIERDNFGGLESALGHAVLAGNVEVARKLLEQGAPMNIPIDIKFGGRDTPMARVQTIGYRKDHENASEMASMFVEQYALRKENKQDGFFSKVAASSKSAFDEFKFKISDLYHDPMTNGAAVIGGVIATGIIAAVGGVALPLAATIIASAAVGSKIGAMIGESNSYNRIVDAKNTEQRAHEFEASYDRMAKNLIKNADNDKLNSWIKKAAPKAP